MVNRYRFMCFAKNISKRFGKTLSRKYSAVMIAAIQKFLDHAKQSLQMHLKPLQKEEFKKQLKQLVV